MPLPVKWSKFTEKDMYRVDAVCGVYELGDADGEIIYVGHGVLRDRLLAHLRGENPCTHKLAEHYRIQKTGSKRRAEQRERAEMNWYAKRHDGNLPLCNRRTEYPKLS